MQCVIYIERLFKIICTFISRICWIYQISKKGGFCREKSGEEKITHVCVCVCRGRVYA